MDAGMFSKSSVRTLAGIVSDLYSWLDLPRTRVPNICEKFNEYLNQSSVQSLFDFTLERLSALGEKPQNVHYLRAMYKRMQKPFLTLETEKQCFAFLKDEGFYFPPKEVTIHANNSFSNKEHDSPEVSDVKVQCIPLHKVLKNFFELPNVLSETMKHLKISEENDILITNIVQEDMWKKKKHFKNGMSCLYYCTTTILRPTIHWAAIKV